MQVTYYDAFPRSFPVGLFSLLAHADHEEIIFSKHLVCISGWPSACWTNITLYPWKKFDHLVNGRQAFSSATA